jgi:hypothetical protein
MCGARWILEQEAKEYRGQEAELIEQRLKGLGYLE